MRKELKHWECISCKHKERWHEAQEGIDAVMCDCGGIMRVEDANIFLRGCKCLTQ